MTWRQGGRRNSSRGFAALRVRPAHRDYWRAEPHPAEWLLIEWPSEEAEPTKYWLSTLPAETPLVELVHMAKQRWIIDGTIRNQRNSASATTKDADGGAFTITPPYASRPMDSWWPNGIFFPSVRIGNLDYQAPEPPTNFSPAVRRVRPERHNPHSIATLRIVLARYLLGRIPHCPFCGTPSG